MSYFKSALFGASVTFLGVSAAAACGTYSVKSGDTLSRIAISQVGSVFVYPAIYEANSAVIGSDPNKIAIGMELEIPCSVSSGTPINWAVLPDATTVAKLRRSIDIQMLDIRTAEEVANGVIPGAIHVPYAMWRGPEDDPSEPPNDRELSKIIGDAGLRLDQPLVVVHAEPGMMDSGRAAMVYWLLKSAGFDTLAILRDGHQGWTQAGLAVVDKPITPKPYAIDLLFSTKWRADELDVYGIATSQVTGFLLDARPESVFAKFDEAGLPVGNTLPTAQNAPIAPLMSAFETDIEIEKGVETVVAHLQRYNANWETGRVVTFCQTGEVGALSWFYASELAGLENMALYPESVTGWANQGGILFEGTNDG